jgi:3-hydroxyisobutyrate dehydrogenase-like beta-hydroxyacid dehydrogenase
MLTGIVQQMMAAMKSKGHGELDHSALVTLIEEMAQIEPGFRS